VTRAAGGTISTAPVVPVVSACVAIRMAALPSLAMRWHPPQKRCHGSQNVGPLTTQVKPIVN
jgi:hypothetical protein